MLRPMTIVALAAALAGCGGGTPAPAPTPTASAAAPTVASTRVSSRAMASESGARMVDERTDLYEFQYSWPTEVDGYPDLRARLEADRAKARKALIDGAAAGRAEAKEGGFEYHAYASGRTWLTVTETPRFLSLSAELYSYEGGAHPNHGYDALVWDKQAGRRLTPVELFTSPAALDAALQPGFCAELDKERGKRRGEAVKSDGSLFHDCIKPSEQTVILGSSNRRAFDKVGVLVGPYAAGPYVEGDYEFTFPLTPALLAAVRPEYRGAFALAR